MVNRVGNNQYTNAYSNNTVKKTSGEEAPAFLLGNEKEGVVWDRQTSDKEKEKTNKQQKLTPQTVEKDSLELKYNKNINIDDKTATAKIESNGINIFSRIGNSIKAFAVRIFNYIWYGDGVDASAAAANSSDRIESASDVLVDSKEAEQLVTREKKEKSDTLKDKDKLIRESISRKDSDEVMRLITDDYTRSPARNSTLLTKYDKRGNIIGVSGADEARILTGKNALKM